MGLLKTCLRPVRRDGDSRLLKVMMLTLTCSMSLVSLPVPLEFMKAPGTGERSSRALWVMMTLLVALMSSLSLLRDLITG